MLPENSIEVKNLHKTFRVYQERTDSLRDRLVFRKKNRYEERRVLQGVSFSVKKGEAIGLIGHNGCGKSTTLKLLTKIIYPNEGTIEMKGRVSSLIELGAGFHPDMTGRENIYTNAAIFGLTKKEIDARVSDIIRFSELEEYIDNPVRTYSSGMYMRLAFSVAINVDADILLIDEILAVGDINFQQKCFQRLKDIKRTGVTIVIVSHSLDQIEAICDKCYWLDGGVIRAEGNPVEVHEIYLSAMNDTMQKRIEKESEDKAAFLAEMDGMRNLPLFCGDVAERKGGLEVEFTDVALYNAAGEKTKLFNTGEEMTLKIEYINHKEIPETNLEFSIFRDDGVFCYRTNYLYEMGKLLPLKKTGAVRIRFPKLDLLQGVYLLNVAMHIGDEEVIYDNIQNVFKFSMFHNNRDTGIARLDTRWQELSLKEAGESHPA